MSDHDDHLRPPWSRSERRIPRGVVRPLQEFLATVDRERVLLFAAAAIALVWANVGDTYEAFWTTAARRAASATSRSATDLRFWVNEGLMTLFFLVAGSRSSAS